MTEPGDEIAADAEGGDRLPVSPVAREQVIRILKAALAQGRLTEDEHDARAAQASAARSDAELAALTADLPAGLLARPPKASDVWKAVCVIVAAASMLGAIMLWNPDNYPAFAMGAFRRRHPDRGAGHNGGPDIRRAAPETVWRAAAAGANPQRRPVIGR